MDFFKYASVASAFVDGNTFWVPFLVGGICFAVVFVFQGIGLYTMAGKEGYAKKWMAFVPFFNTYYIGVCAQKNKCLNSIDAKKFSLAAAIIEAVLFVGYVVYYIGCSYALPYVEEVASGDYYGISSLFSKQYEINSIPAELAWAGWCFTYLYDYILVWFEFIFQLITVVLLLAFFQTYSARRYVLFTITSILFPVQGILIFILRNNRGMNYRDFIRREQERQYRMYQQYQRQNFEQNPYNQNPYSNNYNNANNYNNGGYNQSPYAEYPDASARVGKDNKTAPEDPFAEFGSDKYNDK